MKINSLGYIGFRSPEYRQWSTFGPDILGTPLAPRGQDGAIRLRMDERHHRIAVHPGDIDDLAYIGWELRGREEFEAALRELSDKGIQLTQATKDELADRCVLGMAWLLDPSGFRHELFYGQIVSGEPFHPTRAISGFVSGEHGAVGHVVLAVPELTKAHADFAVETLGFASCGVLVIPKPDGSGADATFYRCNLRSHCLAYIPVGGMRGVLHIYVEVGTLDDVGRTYDLCRRRQVPIAKSLGRYLLDNDISFYIRAPSGWDVQYAVGGENPKEGSAVRAYEARNYGSVAWGHEFLLPDLPASVRPATPRGSD